jgi:hypothetical protein
MGQVSMLRTYIYCAHNEQLHDLYSQPSTVDVTKSRKMSWVGHVAYKGRGEVYIGFWWGNLRKETTWKKQAKRRD